MVDFDTIISYTRTALFGLIALIALFYSIPIVFHSQFYHRANFLTLNICLSIILSCTFWFIFYVMYQIDSIGIYLFMLQSCLFMQIVPTLLTLQIPFSFITTSVNRFCTVKYPQKIIFKSKKWILICILTQWILGTVLTLPIIAGIQPVSLKISIILVFHSNFFPNN